MRFPLALSLALAFASFTGCGPAPSLQTIVAPSVEAPIAAPAPPVAEPSPIIAPTPVTIPVKASGFKVVRKDGAIYYFASYAKKEPWYHFVDMHGTKSTQMIASVESIIDITPAEASAASEARPARADETAAERFVRLRSEARDRAQAQAHALADAVSRLSDSADSDGFTPRGLQKFTGSRGGVYHMSKNGNKVYHSRKK